MGAAATPSLATHVVGSQNSRTSSACWISQKESFKKQILIHFHKQLSHPGFPSHLASSLLLSMATVSSWGSPSLICSHTLPCPSTARVTFLGSISSHDAAPLKTQHNPPFAQGQAKLRDTVHKASLFLLTITCPSPRVLHPGLTRRHGPSRHCTVPLHVAVILFFLSELA